MSPIPTVEVAHEDVLLNNVHPWVLPSEIELDQVLLQLEWDVDQIWGQCLCRHLMAAAGGAGVSVINVIMKEMVVALWTEKAELAVIVQVETAACVCDPKKKVVST